MGIPGQSLTRTASWGGSCRVFWAEPRQDKDQSAAGLRLTLPHSLDPPQSPEGGLAVILGGQAVEEWSDL